MCDWHMPKSFNERDNKASSTPVTEKTQWVWKATGKLFADIGYQWRPTGKKLTLGKLDCGSQWRPTGKKFALGEICQLTKLSVKCRIGHALVSGLRLLKTYNGKSFKAQCGLKYTTWRTGHNLFSVGQFVMSDLEVASKSILALFVIKDLVRGLPRLKFEKDHLCSACQHGKSKKFSHRPKSENTNMEVLHTLHMDLCGPMRVQTKTRKNFQAKADIGIFVGYAPSRRAIESTNNREPSINGNRFTSHSMNASLMAPVHMSSVQSSSGKLNAAEPNQVNYPPDHLRRWTKDHPLDNICWKSSRPCYQPKTLASMLCGADIILTVQIRTQELQNGCDEKTADADHAGFKNTRRSTSGSAQLLGDRLVSYPSQKQRKHGEYQTTEAEYIAMSGCCAQIPLDAIPAPKTTDLTH
ncbi:hypothetical protein Tco_0653198 [Tanacetum coccineum]|uniref:GAG-pre-integrase domain-containing protein n=1 Tax=Tanacetum coccineum TaxID=301880 RepID=A0ABQ4WZT4_9ASTR